VEIKMSLLQNIGAAGFILAYAAAAIHCVTWDPSKEDRRRRDCEIIAAIRQAERRRQALLKSAAQ
jgi:hypothetical protein